MTAATIKTNNNHVIRRKIEQQQTKKYDSNIKWSTKQTFSYPWTGQKIYRHFHVH